jgi:hypothetical protein
MDDMRKHYSEKKPTKYLLSPRLFNCDTVSEGGGEKWSEFSSFEGDEPAIMISTKTNGKGC